MGKPGPPFVGHGAMSHRVLALYGSREVARVAAEDLRASGVEAGRIVLGEGVSAGSGRIEVAARDHDQAIDVQAFLRQDGAYSVEILPDAGSLPVP